MGISLPGSEVIYAVERLCNKVFFFNDSSYCCFTSSEMLDWKKKNFSHSIKVHHIVIKGIHSLGVNMYYPCYACYLVNQVLIEGDNMIVPNYKPRSLKWGKLLNLKFCPNTWIKWLPNSFENNCKIHILTR